MADTSVSTSKAVATGVVKLGSELVLNTTQIANMATVGAAALTTTGVAYLSTAQLAILCTNNDYVVSALKNMAGE